MLSKLTYIHKQGGFEIRNWTSNSIAVLESVPKATLGQAAIRFKVGEQNESERTLGLLWYPREDELGFDVSLKRIPDAVIQGKERPTKRLMLRTLMSVFDIFGFLSPFTIQGRIMLQDTWRSNIGWDTEIPDDIYFRWRICQDLLKEIDKVRIPRCYHNTAGFASTCESGDAPSRSTLEPTVTSSSTQPATSRSRTTDRRCESADKGYV
jgi:hypothetical protein